MRQLSVSATSYECSCAQGWMQDAHRPCVTNARQRHQDSGEALSLLSQSLHASLARFDLSKVESRMRCGRATRCHPADNQVGKSTTTVCIQPTHGTLGFLA